MHADSTIHTVRELMQPTELLNVEDSLGRAASVLRHSTGVFVPVVDGHRLVGVATEARMADCLAEGHSTTDTVERATDLHVSTIPPYATGAAALRMLAETGAPALVVVDDTGRVMGLIEPSDLYPRKPFQPSLGPVGGMATPFGVHLTTGVTSAGVPHWAIVSTGVLLCSLLVVSMVVTEIVTHWMAFRGVPPRYVGWVNGGLPLVLFLAAMRAMPLSGIHAAEHKVVHAIERGEELRPEIVRRMPRVHPRCGTNLAVGATLFLGIATSHWADEFTRTIVAVIVSLLLWRPLGSLLQFYVTTKRPTDKQLQMGIESGRKLIKEYARARTWTPNPLQRIWHSGMVHVVAGSTGTYLVAWAILSLFGRSDWL